ncbi:MAG: GyrI-like domain-containing protein [Promethearchaeota archaeon]
MISYNCEIKERADQPTITIRKRAAVQYLPQVLGESYKTLMQYMGEIGAFPIGAPFVIYYNIDMQDLDLEIGFPVSKKLQDKEDMKASRIQAGKYATCIHIGPYNEISLAYNALNEWMKNNGYEGIGRAIEIYLNDPSETPSEELKTEIQFPLK